MFAIRKNVKIHFVGIGGIGMSGIAEVLLSLGYEISGSDLNASKTVDKLKELGAKIGLGHKAENADGATVMVYSSAVDPNNPELRYAKEQNIPLMKRAEMLAELMRLKYGLAIAGTHGKTTTTSFLATILQESKFDPTYIIGGIVSNLDGHAKVGKGDFLVAEADESDGSFLLLNPIMSVITNIDTDHMDHYGTEQNLLDAFRKFINKVPFYGLCAINIHDEKIREILKDVKKPWVTFGIREEDPEVADFEARSIKYLDFGAKYELFYKNEFVQDLEISLPGRHNILNSLGAVALAYNMGVSFSLIGETIGKFIGVGRRFQLLHKKGNLELLDDYAHHPTEILTTLKTIKDTRTDSKIVVIFEPHRYTRTRDCWEKFLHCFNDGDEVHIAPIYAASEKELLGITSERMVEDINHLHPGLAHKMESIHSLEKIVKGNLSEKTTIITLGAGSIGKVVRELQI